MIYDTGNFQEGSNPQGSATGGHNFQESGALNRNSSLGGKMLNDSFTYSAGWSHNLIGSSSPFAPYSQSYNMVVGGTTNSSGATPSSNALVSGIGYTNVGRLWQSGDPNADYPSLSTNYPSSTPIYDYEWYDAGGSNSQNAQFDWQDWQIPGTWTISFTKSTAHLNTAGTIKFYAVCGGATYLLATMDAASTAGHPSSFSFDSTTAFGAGALWQLRAVMTGMGGTWTGTWQYGHYLADLTTFVLVDSGTNNFPPTGENWNESPDPNIGPGNPTNDYMASFNMTAVPGCSFGISGTRTGP